MAQTIGNPLSWAARRVGSGMRRVSDGTAEIVGFDAAPIVLTGLTLADIRIALRKGGEDFLALRTDVIFIVLLYPLVGLVLAGFALHQGLLPLLFPLASGFALLGPFAAIGLYEMSRRREQGLPTGWGDAFGVFASPSLFPILMLGFYLFALFLAWLISANVIYDVTLGPDAPVSASAFLQDVFATPAGWTMIVLGVGIGFLFACLVLATSLIAFPLLIDRHVGMVRAVVTSLSLTRRHPVAALAWGGVVVLGLALGAATLFVGLIVVLPILGHASWHLYRRAVAPPAGPR